MGGGFGMIFLIFDERIFLNLLEEKRTKSALVFSRMRLMVELEPANSAMNNPVENKKN